SNDAVNRGGPTFVSRLQDLTGHSAAEIVEAYVLVRDGFGLEEIYEAVDAVDNKVAGAAQLGFYAAIGRLVHSATAWFLRNGAAGSPLGTRIEDLQRSRQVLEPKLIALLPELMRETVESRHADYESAGAPAELAGRLALLGVSELIPDIAAVAKAADASLIL